TPDQKLSLTYTSSLANQLFGGTDTVRPTSLVVIYSYGDFRAASRVARSDDAAAKPIEITRESCVPPNKVVAFFSNPFGDLEASRVAPLHIDNALISPIPDSSHGWLVAITLFIFMAFFAIGPGVCVWLALSELMPTRIRSNGMSIALVLNQAVSTTIAAVFLSPLCHNADFTLVFWFARRSSLSFV